MPDFAVFGGVFRAPFPFPELPPASGREPNWVMEIGNTAPPLHEAQSLGIDDVYGTCKVRAFKRSGGYTLVYDDTGRFDVSGDGRRITWYDSSERLLEAARADVIGRVLPLALHAGGILSLHASAVAIGDEGIAFLAPKFHGKSTLATALLEEGARLLSDDVLPVRISEPPLCSPGVPRLRLWHDAARATLGDGSRVPPDSKLIVDTLGPERIQEHPVRFTTAYLLTPVKELGDGAVVERDRIEPIFSALALVEQAKLGPLLTGSEMGALFSQSASVAAGIEVFDLAVVRDLDRLREVARTVVGWHASGAPRPT
jgi:hypothetical protein